MSNATSRRTLPKTTASVPPIASVLLGTLRHTPDETYALFFALAAKDPRLAALGYQIRRFTPRGPKTENLEVIRLRHVEKKKESQIADLIDKPIEVVKAVLRRHRRAKAKRQRPGYGSSSVA